MRKTAVVLALSGAAAFVSCGEREQPFKSGEDYLTLIEKGEYWKAYTLIDGISRRYATREQFIAYWEQFTAKYGVPVSHDIFDEGKDPPYIVIDYYWNFKPGTGNPRFFEDKRAMRLKLRREFFGWRVKFLKYKIIYEERTP